MFDWFNKWVSEFCYSILQVILRLVHYFQEVFMILSGAKEFEDVVSGLKEIFQKNPDMNNTVNNNLGNVLLDMLFGYWENGSNTEKIGKIFMVFFFISTSLFVIAILVGVIKSMLAADKQTTLKKTLNGSLKALLYFFGVPIISYVGLTLGSKLILLVVDSIGNIVGNNTSIAESLFKACYAGEISPNIFDRISIVEDMSIWDNEALLGEGSLTIGGRKYQYLIAILAGVIILWSFFIATIGLVERIINICLLYIISPAVVATIPLDDGERLKTWKDLLLAKFLGAIGNIISMFIFIVFINYWSVFINDLRHIEGFDMSPGSSNYWITTILYLVIGCGGAFVCAKGSLTISSIISQRAQGEDGLSQMATSQLAGKGLQLAGKLGAGMLGKIFGKKNQGGITSGNGGTGNVGNTGGNGGGEQTSSKMSADGGFTGNNVQQNKNSLNTNGGSSGLKNKLLSGAKNINMSKGKALALGAIGAATAIGLASPAILGTIGAIGAAKIGSKMLGKGAVNGAKKSANLLGKGVNFLKGKMGFNDINKKIAKKNVKANNAEIEKLNDNIESADKKIAKLDKKLGNDKLKAKKRNKLSIKKSELENQKQSDTQAKEMLENNVFNEKVNNGLALNKNEKAKLDKMVTEGKNQRKEKENIDLDKSGEQRQAHKAKGEKYKNNKKMEVVRSYKGKNPEEREKMKKEAQAKKEQEYTRKKMDVLRYTKGKQPEERKKIMAAFNKNNPKSNISSSNNTLSNKGKTPQQQLNQKQEAQANKAQANKKKRNTVKAMPDNKAKKRVIEEDEDEKEGDEE